MGPPGSPEQDLTGLDKNQQEEMMKRLVAGLGGEFRGYAELAHKTDIPTVRHDTRIIMGMAEKRYWEFAHRPNPYAFEEGFIPQLITRANQLRFTLPLGFSEYTQKDVQAGLDQETPESIAKREGLAAEYERSALEMQARVKLLEKLAEQEIFEGDVEEYMVNYFVRLGKQRMDTRYYGVIFNLPPTHEGFRPYGGKVETAIDLWKNVAEGKATVDLVVAKADGTQEIKTRRLPNVFALPRNTQLMQLVIDKYIVPHLGNAAIPEDISTLRKRAIALLEDFDNNSAAITALNILDHWDKDMEWGIGTEGYKEELTDRDIENLTLELSYKDSGKAAYFEQRRASEWRGAPGKKDERRTHPRVAGAPATLGCYPRLTTDAMRIMTTDAFATTEKDYSEQQIKKIIEDTIKKVRDMKKTDKVNVEMDMSLAIDLGMTPDELRLLKDGFKKNGFEIELDDVENVKDLMRYTRIQRISVSIEDMVWGQEMSTRPGYTAIKRLVDKKEVVWQVQKRKLGEIMWDKVLVWDFEGDIASILPTNTTSVEVLDYALGVPTGAFEVPYKLQGFLAYKFIFAQIMRSDYVKQFDEVINSDLLLKMNKGIDNALGLLATAYNLDSDTKKALEEYVRVIFLGGLAASIITRGMHGVHEGFKLEERSQVPNLEFDKNPVRESLLRAARTFNFLKFRDELPESPQERKKALVEGKTLDPDEEKLLDYIIQNRKAPTPFELEDVVPGWFTEEQLNLLRPLYPSIK